MAIAHQSTTYFSPGHPENRVSPGSIHKWSEKMVKISRGDLCPGQEKQVQIG
ncbi:hypothetical protein [Pseudomonas farris]